MSLSHSSYRPEIDGLRAIAVLPVIFYHAGFVFFSGGYIGVDVFFVISGYLITTIMIKDLELERFSLVSFYERRVRRILPALYFLLVFTTIVAIVVYLPRDLLDYFKSLFSVIVYGSNIFFWLDADYFATDSDLLPLLHTWSLSVEEQFYLLFPLLLASLFRFGTTVVYGVIGSIVIVSLTVSIWAGVVNPEMSFYLLPSRAWELGVGCMGALYHRHHGQLSKSRYADAIGMIGLMMIATSIHLFDHQTDFPSYNALLPTIGTVLLLLFTDERTRVGRILGSKMLVGIGLVSYSAYLWHHPLFAFARYLNVGPLSTAQYAVLIAITMVLAYMSWKFVEAPFRDKHHIGSKSIWTMAGATSILFVLVALVGIQQDGFRTLYEGRLDNRQLAIWQQSEITRHDPVATDGECVFRSRSLDSKTIDTYVACSEIHGQSTIIFGDSHAMDVYNAYVYTKDEPFVLGLADAGCRIGSESDQTCFFGDLVDFVEKYKLTISKIYYNQAGFYLLQDENGQPGTRAMFKRHNMPVYNPNTSSIDPILEYLGRLEDYAPITWIGPWTEPHLNGNMLLRNAIECQLIRNPVHPSIVLTFDQLDDTIRQRLQSSGIPYISSIDRIQFDWDVDLYGCEGSFWRDGDHFNTLGEKRFGARLFNE